MRLKDKVAIITGAGQGIGQATALKFAREGSRVAVCDINRSAVDMTVEAIVANGGEALGYTIDVTDKASIAKMVEGVMGAWGRIDTLVNNAGIAPNITLADGTDEALDEIFEINVKGPFRLIQAALPHLKAAGQGRVVNVASLSGKRVSNLNVGYQMSKHALVALTHAVRRVGFEHGIRATALCPGFVATDLTADVVDMPRAQMIDAADLAVLAATLIELPNNASVAELLVSCRYEHTM